MKLKIIVAALITLGIVSQVSANDDGLTLDSGLQSFDDTGSTMSWPVLPHESVNDVARMFYPKNRAMQRQFVAKTLRLNAAQGHKVNPAARSDEPSLLVVPTIKSLSYATRAGNANKAKAKRKKPHKQKMQMSYRIKELSEKVPAALVKEYEYLVGKNSFLKQELDKLNKRLGVLQTKVEKLSLIFDKTFNYPYPNTAQDAAPTQTTASNDAPTAALPAANATPAATTPAATAAATPDAAATPASTPAKKVFKNLSAPPVTPSMSDKAISVILQTSDTPEPVEAIASQEPEGAIFNSLNRNLLILGFGLIGLAMLGSHLLRKYRQRMYDQFSLSTMPMQDSQMDFGGYWEDTKQADEPQPANKPSSAPAGHVEAVPDTIQLAQPAQKAAIAFPNTEARAANTKVEVILQTAKLLVNADRSQDAISHLKQAIEEQPKGSIEHWLYLLEIFRKLKLKADFESYAERLNQTFNVMTPVWYESKSSNVSMVVPQYLEEFPHIMGKLYAEWPSKFASEYLHSLIVDNREGVRTGFCTAVLDEILCLIALLEARKEFE
jgi:hypothetical protein